MILVRLYGFDNKNVDCDKEKILTPWFRRMVVTLALQVKKADFVAKCCLTHPNLVTSNRLQFVYF